MAKKSGHRTPGEHRDQVEKAREAASRKAKNDAELIHCIATCKITGRPFDIWIKKGQFKAKSQKYPGLRKVKAARTPQRLSYYE